ncbi:MAG: hypothetical protein FJ333_05345 [Sphingomonadales bacterium]|nr:hypothetical protein [Sphingomonadales bacterium]
MKISKIENENGGGNDDVRRSRRHDETREREKKIKLVSLPRANNSFSDEEEEKNGKKFCPNKNFGQDETGGGDDVPVVYQSLARVRERPITSLGYCMQKNN